MLVELTDKEVRMVGEQRWLRPRWVRFLVFLAVWGVAVIAGHYLVPVDAVLWVKVVVLIASITPGIIFGVWYNKNISKAGKLFLEESHKGLHETQT